MLHPKRSPSAKIGHRGEAIVQAHLSSIAVCNPLAHDFGHDLLCHLDDGEFIRNAFMVQIKTQQKLTQKSVRIRLKMSTVQHWASSPVPVYLIVCVLEPVPRFLWREAIQEVTRKYGPLEGCRRLKVITLTLGHDEFSDDSIFAKLPKSVRSISKRLDDSINATIALGQLPRKSIRNEKVPVELAQLGATVQTYYAISKETRALFVDHFISAWEKIEYRLAWGYPVAVLRVGLLIGHATALKAGLKSLYYMESDVIRAADADLRSVATSMTYNARFAALVDSLSEFHRSRYVQNPNFDDILAHKISKIICRIFAENDVVPVLTKALTILRKRFPIKRGVYPKGPNAIQAIESALNYLREFKDAGPVIPSMAIDLFERDMALSPGWSWDSKVHIISYHHLQENRLPRAFEQMTAAGRKLIVDGLERHPDPLVRLDCLRVYGNDIEKWSLAILTYTRQKLAEAASDEDSERLTKVLDLVTSYVRKCSR